jgi:hypothetical protein
VPRYEFWINERESIDWVLDRRPTVGEVYDFGMRGIWRVVGPRFVDDPVFTDDQFAVVRASDSDGERANEQP